MWTSLILSMLLLHCLVALPAPEPKDLDSWSADTASQEVDNSVMLENQNDSTCVTQVFCYIVNESKRVLVQGCKSGHSTYSISLKVCTATKPDGSVEATAEATSTTVATTAATKTTVTTTTDSTNTSEPWSAEATCLTATKSTVLQNQDDPTCTT
ncbi:uncharacterized protein LOC119552542 [Drosophila subpulchrella]|uniref:uncharacterized protein LOC119552542 n=1 Tax=Drosophila subpulchrella TaxID=1486046 RepID=UPI0018A16812|nr:uncharacterized protein LOC119552542 [Drosophila subpulchrella]